MTDPDKKPEEPPVEPIEGEDGDETQARPDSGGNSPPPPKP